MNKILLLTLVLSANVATAAICYSGNDRQIASYTGTEIQSCTGPGYCYGYGYDPATGDYDYFYGFQSDCSGHQDRNVDTAECQRPDGTQYTVDNSGSFGVCQVP
jgi:hypothetical protein